MKAISIFMSVYAGGDKVEEELCRRLGFTLVSDSDIIQKASQVSGVSVSHLKKATQGSPWAFNQLTHHRERALICLKKTILDYIYNGDCVFNGLLGHLIPSHLTSVMKVFITATYDYRLTTGLLNSDLGHKRLNRNLTEADKRACQFVYGVSGRILNDPRLYDMILPVDQIENSETGNVINRILEGYGAIDLTEAEPFRELREAALSTEIESLLAPWSERLQILSDKGHITVLVKENLSLIFWLKRYFSAKIQKVEGVQSVRFVFGHDHRSNRERMYPFDVPLRVLMNHARGRSDAYVSSRLKHPSPVKGVDEYSFGETG